MSVPAPIPTGVVSMLEGVVRVIRAGGKSAGALKVGDALQAGDVIFASAGTSFQLTGADGQLWTPPEGGLPADQATGVGVVTALADMRKALLAQGQASLDEAVARLNQATACPPPSGTAPAPACASAFSTPASRRLRVACCANPTCLPAAPPGTPPHARRGCTAMASPGHPARVSCPFFAMRTPRSMPC